MKKLWNMIRWGSAEGPEIFIDWNDRTLTLTFLRCSDRLTARTMSWIKTSHPLKSVTVIDENGVTVESTRDPE